MPPPGRSVCMTSTVSSGSCCAPCAQSISACPPSSLSATSPPNRRATMDDNLDQLLRNLKLHKLRQILPDEVKKAMKAKASYEELLVAVFRAQYQDQIERSIQSRIRHARVPEKWSLATFPFDRQPGVEARVIRQLGTLDFVGCAENLVLVGPPGVG